MDPREIIEEAGGIYLEFKGTSKGRVFSFRDRATGSRLRMFEQEITNVDAVTAHMLRNRSGLPGVMRRIPWPLRVGVVASVIVGALHYWLGSGLHVSRLELSWTVGILAGAGAGWFAHVQDRPRRMVAEFDERQGYWQLCSLKQDRICFAMQDERGKIPDSVRGSPNAERLGPFIGRIHCLVEDEFWIWRERWGPPSVGLF